MYGDQPNLTLDVSGYQLLFIDDHSRSTCIYFLKQTSLVLMYFKVFKTMVENQFQRSISIKVLRSSSGGEYIYMSNEF